ncbi:MAG: acyltransferase domain-containing protein, partial [Oscillospiraceae bacterium]|nr:acyltransferase domain-containing protein [Oscillospiraceae bacterium]
MDEIYAKFEKYLGYYGLCEEGKNFLREAAKKICQDAALTARALEIKGKLADTALDLKWDEEFAGASPQFGAFVFTLAIEDMEKLYEDKNIPRGVLLETIDDLGVWIKRQRDWFGEWGFTQHGWLILHLRAKIFKLGR